MVARLWGHADTAYPSRDLNPEDFGWKKLNGVYSPLWFDGTCLPEDIRGQQEEETKPEEDEPEQDEPEPEDDETEPEEDEHQSPDSNEEAKKMKDIQEAEWSDSSSDKDDDSDPI